MRSIKTFEEFIKEDADYRNVTGHGSMGNPDPQNAGPTFSKGMDSETYGRPTVIGVVRDTIEDPYFNQGDVKRRRVKKHPHVEKTRKKKSKYLRNVDRKSLKNRIDEGYKYTLVEENSVKLSDLIEKNSGNLEKVANELNIRFAGKWVIATNLPDGEIIIFKTDKFTKYRDFVSADVYDYFNENTGVIRYGLKELPVFGSDVITEINILEPKRIYTENDPLGEEDWDF